MGMRKLALGLLCLVAFAIPWESAVVIGDIGSLPRFLGMSAAASGLLAVVVTGRLRRPGVALVLTCAYVLWNALTLFWTVAPEMSATRVETYLQLALLAWLIWEFAPTPRAQHAVLRAYLVGACVSILTSIAGVVSGTVAASRATAFGADPNDLGLMLALGIPSAWHLLLTSRRRAARWLYGAYIPAAIVTVLLTASRGALLATTVATAAVFASSARASLRVKVSALLLAAATVYAAPRLVPQASWQRLAAGREEIESGTLSYRLVIWRVGALQFLRHPVAGVGAGGFPATTVASLGRPYAAHNAYLGILVEQGLIGFGIFVALCTVLLRRLRQLPPLQRHLCVALGLTWAVGVASLSWEHRKPTWFVLGMLVAQTGAVCPARRRVRGSRAQSRPLMEARPCSPLP